MVHDYLLFAAYKELSEFEMSFNDYLLNKDKE